MSVEVITFTLTAAKPWPQHNNPSEVSLCFGVPAAPFAFRPQEYADAAVCLVVGTVKAADYQHLKTEMYEAFEAEVNESLQRFEGWLQTVPAESSKRFKAANMSLKFIVSLWMTRDQMEFTLPPGLAAELGRLGIRLYLISHE